MWPTHAIAGPTYRLQLSDGKRSVLLELARKSSAADANLTDGQIVIEAESISMAEARSIVDAAQCSPAADALASNALTAGRPMEALERLVEPLLPSPSLTSATAPAAAAGLRGGEPPHKVTKETKERLNEGLVLVPWAPADMARADVAAAGCGAREAAEWAAWKPEASEGEAGDGRAGCLATQSKEGGTGSAAVAHGQTDPFEADYLSEAAAAVTARRGQGSAGEPAGSTPLDAALAALAARLDALDVRMQSLTQPESDGVAAEGRAAEGRAVRGSSARGGGVGRSTARADDSWDATRGREGFASMEEATQALLELGAKVVGPPEGDGGVEWDELAGELA